MSLYQVPQRVVRVSWKKIVTLFEGAADKLSLLWKALSSAKDKMAEGLKDVIDRCTILL